MTKKKTNGTNAKAKLLVAEVYWHSDQACKEAKRKRDDVRDLAITAIELGETVGPVRDEEGVPHWLTHSTREDIVMDAVDLPKCLDIPITGLLALCTVNIPMLRMSFPEVYVSMLKRKSTTRTTHDVLTWKDSDSRSKS